MITLQPSAWVQAAEGAVMYTMIFSFSLLYGLILRCTAPVARLIPRIGSDHLSLSTLSHTLSHTCMAYDVWCMVDLSYSVALSLRLSLSYSLTLTLRQP